mmetsp:Transcript_13949/g.32484  ORF Transcript_13949/g.32484 Transcript_13949/m.32484 type:complete len:406 (-) Transcript_13949:784-2001(-)
MSALVASAASFWAFSEAAMAASTLRRPRTSVVVVVLVTVLLMRSMWRRSASAARSCRSLASSLRVSRSSIFFWSAVARTLASRERNSARCLSAASLARSCLASASNCSRVERASASRSILRFTSSLASSAVFSARRSSARLISRWFISSSSFSPLRAASALRRCSSRSLCAFCSSVSSWSFSSTCLASRRDSRRSSVARLSAREFSSRTSERCSCWSSEVVVFTSRASSRVTSRWRSEVVRVALRVLSVASTVASRIFSPVERISFSFLRASERTAERSRSAVARAVSRSSCSFLEAAMACSRAHFSGFSTFSGRGILMSPLGRPLVLSAKVQADRHAFFSTLSVSFSHAWQELSGMRQRPLMKTNGVAQSLGVSGVDSEPILRPLLELLDSPALPTTVPSGAHS